MCAYLEYLRKGQNRLEGTPHDMLHIYQTRAELFTLAGALHLDGGTMPLLEDKALPVLEALANLPVGIGNVDTAVTSFLKQEKVLLRHCSFSVKHIEQEASFPWSVHPLPHDPGGAIVPDMTQLAINRNTAHLPECLEMIRTLVSDGAQARFGALHSNLPVLKSVFKSEAYSKESPLPIGVQEAQLAIQTLRVLPPIWLKLLDALLPIADLEQLWRKELSPEQVMQRMRLYLGYIA
ncbi:MAG: hypothetical protein HQL31_07225 [Planctomycetes bacterium]|nr:hypothetical protein [Planctomycetota bacterium]